MACARSAPMSRDARSRHRKRRHINQHRWRGQRSHRPPPRHLRYWTMAVVASGAMTAALPASARAEPFGPVKTESRRPAPPQSARAGDHPALNFDIAPGPLSEVLPLFERTAGVTVALAVDSIGLIQSP